VNSWVRNVTCTSTKWVDSTTNWSALFTRCFLLSVFNSFSGRRQGSMLCSLYKLIINYCSSSPQISLFVQCPIVVSACTSFLLPTLSAFGFSLCLRICVIACSHSSFVDRTFSAAYLVWNTLLSYIQAITETHTHMHTHPFNGPLSGTTQVSRYQKGKTNLDFTETRDSEWQWHPLVHMQVCTSLQSDNHASTPPLSFLQARCPSCCPTNSVKALKYISLKQSLKGHIKSVADLGTLLQLFLCTLEVHLLAYTRRFAESSTCV